MRLHHAALVGVATLAGLALSPTITLAKDEVDVPIPPDRLIEEFRRRFSESEADILASGGDRMVRRFAGKAGPFPYRTVELVEVHADAITFEHLSGPFSQCDERFQFTPVDEGTRITHTGTFQLRGGLWTAPLAIGPVKRAFEAHVHEHLVAMAAEFNSARGSE